jgi:hypothetical protein
MNKLTGKYENIQLPVIFFLTFVHGFKISASVILISFFGRVGEAQEIQSICLLFASLKIPLILKHILSNM